MTAGMAGLLVAMSLLVIVFGACGTRGTGRSAWMANMCGLLSMAALVVMLLMIAAWPTPELAKVTTHASAEWQWDSADAISRANVEDSLQCCGYGSADDRYTRPP